MISKETNRAKQAAFRERKKTSGLEEVRGIFLPLILHPELKKTAAALAANHKGPKMNTTKNLITHQMAFRLLGLLEERILSGNCEQIMGYTKMAELINWEGGAKFGQTAGQATSVLDYASFISGMPMLAGHYVRRPDGSLPEGWFGGVFGPFNQEMQEVAAAHVWTREGFAKVRASLCGLPADGAGPLWTDAGERGEKFIRHWLHRCVRSAA